MEAADDRASEGEGEGEGEGGGAEHGSVGHAGATGVGPARYWEDASEAAT